MNKVLQTAYIISKFRKILPNGGQHSETIKNNVFIFDK